MWFGCQDEGTWVPRQPSERHLISSHQPHPTTSPISHPRPSPHSPIELSSVMSTSIAMNAEPTTPGASTPGLPLRVLVQGVSPVPSPVSPPSARPGSPVASSLPTTVLNEIPISTSSFPAGLRTPGGDGALLQQMFHVIDNCDYLVDSEHSSPADHAMSRE